MVVVVHMEVDRAGEQLHTAADQTLVDLHKAADQTLVDLHKAVDTAADKVVDKVGFHKVVAGKELVVPLLEDLVDTELEDKEEKVVLSMVVDNLDLNFSIKIHFFFYANLYNLVVQLD